MDLNSRGRQRLLWIGAPLAVALSTFGLQAPTFGQDEGAKCGSEHLQRPSQSQTVAGGLRAVIDPVTRERIPEGRPSKSQAIPPAQALSRSSEGLTIVHRTDGSKHLNLQGRFMCGSVARIDANGPRVYCISSALQEETVRRHDESPQVAPEVKSPCASE